MTPYKMIASAVLFQKKNLQLFFLLFSISPVWHILISSISPVSTNSMFKSANHLLFLLPPSPRSITNSSGSWFSSKSVVERLFPLLPLRPAVNNSEAGHGDDIFLPRQWPTVGECPTTSDTTSSLSFNLHS